MLSEIRFLFSGSRTFRLRRFGGRRRRRAIIADGFDGATVPGFFGESQFLVCFRLVKHNAVPALIITTKYRGRGLATQIAIDAIGIHVPTTGHVLWKSIFVVSHITFFLFHSDSGRSLRPAIYC